VLPDPVHRSAVLEWLFLKGLEVSVADLWTTPDVRGVARWVPPGRGAVPVGALLAATVSIPMRFRGATRRFFAYGRSIGALRKRVQPAGAWYLDGIGVAPEYQHCGVGAALMQPGLDAADRAQASVFLLTNAPDNLRFYERFGFRVDAEEETPPAGPVSWAMTRKPR
jgi:ribosomal protein S18 acetylase RimI-like enzyme